MFVRTSGPMVANTRSTQISHPTIPVLVGSSADVAVSAISAHVVGMTTALMRDGEYVVHQRRHGDRVRRPGRADPDPEEDSRCNRPRPRCPSRPPRVPRRRTRSTRRARTAATQTLASESEPEERGEDRDRAEDQADRRRRGHVEREDEAQLVQRRARPPRTRAPGGAAARCATSARRASVSTTKIAPASA